MALQDLKEQLRDQLIDLKSRIEESSTFNSLRERYDSLSPFGQRVLLLSATVILFLGLVYIPYSYFSASSESIAQYEERRSMIRQLLQAQRESSQSGAAANPPTMNELSQNVRNRIARFSLLPEQIRSITPSSEPVLKGALSPRGINQETLIVDLKALNVKQTIDISFDLQNVAPGVRLVNFNMSPSMEHIGYYDVTFKLGRFFLPQLTQNNNSSFPSPQPGSRRGSQRGSQRSSPSEAIEDDE